MVCVWFLFFLQTVVMVVFAATACMSFVAVSVAALQPHTLQNITELTIFLQDLSFAAQIGGAALSGLNPEIFAALLPRRYSKEESLHD